MFAAAALAFVAFGTAMLIGIRLDPERAPMAVYYLSMTCRCPWHNMQKAMMYIGQGQQWSIHAIPGPFRYRVLVPWLAGQLPFAAETSLSAITYASLAVTYLMVLLSARRLGVGAGASVCGLALAYAFEPNLFNYYHPFLVDGFGLMVVAMMLYALTIDSFWTFAIFGVCGVFAREATLLLLPVWCARGVKRGVALTAMASLALFIERSVLVGPPDTIDPMMILMRRVHNPLDMVITILPTWSWAFAVLAIGIILLPAKTFRTIGPMSLGVLVTALFSFLLATDVMRLFGVLIPVVAIAAAGLITVLAERRQRLLLTLLVGLVVLQFCVSGGTRLSPDPDALARSVRPVWLGMTWALAAAFMVRRELTDGIRQKFGLPPGAFTAP
ncbi:MAG: hypothetical protein HY047_13905 [Acidobacteria bacterium]|nr:hypothetical protein [Acidobacteriota bacterium]